MEPELLRPFMTEVLASTTLFCHRGTLDQGILQSLGSSLRCQLMDAGIPGPQARKAFSVFMEMAQNILHYAVPGGWPQALSSTRWGALIVARSGKGLLVLCGSRVLSAQIPRLRGRLESICAMEPERARKAYRFRLASAEPEPGSRGAGLGLLTMASVAQEPLAYAFEPDPLGQEGVAFLVLRALL